MHVETYEAISLDEQNGQIINEVVSEEALALIESLGLDGQKALVQRDTIDGEEVEHRNPYRRITAEEEAIYGELMPRRMPLERYGDGPIPLRVLQVAAHAKPLFGKLVVWCPEVGRDDPILIGQNGSDWSPERYLLARWGEVLEPLDALREKAEVKLRTKLEREIAVTKSKLEAFESTLPMQVRSYLHGERTETFVESISFSTR